MGLINTSNPDTPAMEEVEKILTDFGNKVWGACLHHSGWNQTKAQQAIAALIERRCVEARHQAEDDMLHKVGDVLAWHIAQGRIELRHLHLEHIMNALAPTRAAGDEEGK